MKQNSTTKNILFKVTVGILALLLVISAIALSLIFYSYYDGQRQYDELKQYVNIGDEIVIDWDALKAINPDLVGWIYMPDTVISYPIVWKQFDNDYYLTHNFNNQSSIFGAEYGCIFLSGQNRSDFSDNSNFIFGHNMYNGTIFSVFSDNQGNSEWFNSHRKIYILTQQGNYTCETYAQNKVNQSRSDIAYSSFASAEALTNYVEERRADSIVEADPLGEDSNNMTKLFSFSTCSSPDSSNRIITFASSIDFSNSINSFTDEDFQNVTNDTFARIE